MNMLWFLNSESWLLARGFWGGLGGDLEHEGHEIPRKARKGQGQLLPFRGRRHWRIVAESPEQAVMTHNVHSVPFAFLRSFRVPNGRMFKRRRGMALTPRLLSQGWERGWG